MCLGFMNYFSSTGPLSTSHTKQTYPSADQESRLIQGSGPLLVLGPPGIPLPGFPAGPEPACCSHSWSGGQWADPSPGLLLPFLLRLHLVWFFNLVGPVPVLPNVAIRDTP